MIQLGLQSGSLMPSDAIRVGQVLKQDAKYAAQLMVMLEEKNRKNKMEESAALQEQNAQVQAQAAQATAQAQAQVSQMMLQSEIQKLQAEYELKSQLSAQEHAQALEEIKMKNAGAKAVAEVNSDGKLGLEAYKTSVQPTEQQGVL